MLPQVKSKMHDFAQPNQSPWKSLSILASDRILAMPSAVRESENGNGGQRAENRQKFIAVCVSALFLAGRQTWFYGEGCDGNAAQNGGLRRGRTAADASCRRGG